MEVKTFIDNYREAFGTAADLPIGFWYSDQPVGSTDKVNGCFFKGLSKVQEGNAISLGLESIGCGGGKFYTGFTEMPERIPNFVSLKEKYKETPELVKDFIEVLGVPLAENTYLNFVRIDQIDSFDNLEGLLFLAAPDILSGLTTWAWFDTNRDDAVVTTFGSGCSSVVTQTVLENRNNGHRTFLGFFDPSVRPHFDENILSYAIPMSRFAVMYETMRNSCLFDTHAWAKIKERINRNEEKSNSEAE